MHQRVLRQPDQHARQIGRGKVLCKHRTAAIRQQNRRRGMRGGKAEIKVRRALLYYALRRLGLDTDPAARKPHDQQIVLLNRDVILGRQGQAEEQ